MTPAVVGLVRTEMYGRQAWAWRASAALVLAICIRLSIPSYIRAPPEAETRMTGIFFLVQSSMSRVIFSPTTEPMLAARNPKSMTPSPVLIPSMEQVPVMIASFRPVDSW